MFFRALSRPGASAAIVRFLAVELTDSIGFVRPIFAFKPAESAHIPAISRAIRPNSRTFGNL